MSEMNQNERLPGAPPETTPPAPQAVTRTGPPGEFDSPEARDAWRMAQTLMRSKLYSSTDRNGRQLGFTAPDEIFALGMAMAAADKCSYMEAVARVPNEFWIVEGRPCMKTDVMAAKWQLSGGTIRFQGWSTPDVHPITGEKSDPIRLERSGGRCALELYHPRYLTTPVVFETTLEQLMDRGVALTRNGELKDNYKHYPGKMVYARTLSDALRTVAPFLIYNMITPEEVIDLVEDERTGAWVAPTTPRAGTVATDPLGLTKPALAAAPERVDLAAEAQRVTDAEIVNAAKEPEPAAKRQRRTVQRPPAQPATQGPRGMAPKPQLEVVETPNDDVPEVQVQATVLDENESQLEERAEAAREEQAATKLPKYTEPDVTDPDDERAADASGTFGMSFQALRFSRLAGLARNGDDLHEYVPTWPRITAGDYRTVRDRSFEIMERLREGAMAWSETLAGRAGTPAPDLEARTDERVVAILAALKGEGITGGMLDWVLPGHHTKRVRSFDMGLVIDWLDSRRKFTPERAAAATTAPPAAPTTDAQQTRRSRLLG